ncbi:MAG: HEAT repeat domain-containing protein [Phycisphaerales bacterium]
MTAGPIQLEQTMKQVSSLPLRLQVAALGEGLLAGEGVECQHFALRLAEIAGYGQHRIDDDSLGPIGLLTGTVTGLSSRWRARHADSALMALAMGWDQLTPALRGVAVALGRGRWISAAKEMGQSPHFGVRERALSIAMDTGDPGLGVMVCSMLGDEHQQVRRAADKTLLRLVLRMFGHLDAQMLGPEFDAIRKRPLTPMLGDSGVLELERCAMLGAIADAAWSFSSHRCRSPLLASLLLMDRRGSSAIERRAFDKMRRLLSERNHPSHMPMRTVLRTTPIPILRERALRWLVIDPISGVAAARLEVAESLPEHVAVLDQMHLCVRPSRARGLKKVKIASRQEGGEVRLLERAPMLSTDEFGELSSDQKRGYIRWVHGVELDPGTKRTELESVMADADPMVRMHGCSVADSLDLVDYLYDQNETVARHAAMRWSGVGGNRGGFGSPSWRRRLSIAELNARSGSSAVRRVSREEICGLVIDQPDSPSSRLQARRLLASDPAGFVRAVRAMLRDETDRGRAVRMILALGVEERFEMDLVGLSQERGIEPRVGASVVRGLSAIDSEGAEQAVLGCLEDDDRRVVSNAVESGHVPVESLLEFAGDGHHRVRSSALRRMIVDGSDDVGTNGLGTNGLGTNGLDNTMSNRYISETASDELGRMLQDSRVMHRLAGVWAAQRVLEPKFRQRLGGHWKDVVMSMHSLSQIEPDDRVRKRAELCVHRLIVTQRAQQTQYQLAMETREELAR